MMPGRMKFFIAAIAVMGVIRFVLSVSGVPDGIVKYYSMTAIMAAGTFYFAITSASRKERLKAAYLLIAPYMTIEMLALAYTWASGHQTIFHSADYSFGFSIAVHTIGHIVGGVTWEPLFLFVVMEIVRAIYYGGSLLLKARPTA